MGWGFIGIIGGTPDKRISEGLFCRLFLTGIIGGTPDKGISEGLFFPFFSLINVFLSVYFALFCFFFL